MTPGSDILTPAVLLPRARCSLNFHGRPRASVTRTGGNAGCPGPPSPPLPSPEQQQQQQQRPGLQLLNQSLRLHIRISYSQAINRRPTAGFPPLPKFFPAYPDSQQRKTRFSWRETAHWCHESGVFLQRAEGKKRREAFFRDNITCDAFAYRILISAEL